MGTQAAEQGTETGEDVGLLWFITAIHHRSVFILDLIVTMGETMVLYHTRRQKNRVSSKSQGASQAPWRLGSMPARRSKWSCVFWLARLHLCPYRPQGCCYQLHLHHQGPGHVHGAPQEEEAAMAEQHWWFNWFNWDNAPVHRAASVKEWMAGGSRCWSIYPIHWIWHQLISFSSGE